VRDGKDDMEVVGGEKFSLSRRHPPFAGLRLALRTVPVAARNGEISITCLMGSIF
jgi:hypothetical protein